MYVINWLLEAWNRLIDGLPVYGPKADFTAYLPSMATLSLLIGLAVALLILLLLALLNKFHHGRWNMSGKALTTLFCVTWLMGFVVYEIGIYTGEPWSLVLNAPMAMIHAFEMFILENDAAALHPEFHENLTYMAVFSMAHFLAAAVSMIFVIKHFGFNIVAGFRMLFEAYFKKSRKETYVFWGMNEPSYLLAKSIKDNHTNDKDYRIIVVRTGADSDRTSVRNGMERLFNFLSLKNKDLERLQDLNCLTTNTFIDVSKLNVAATIQDGDAASVLKKQLNLRQLSRILSRKTTAAIHLFFLGEDASANIQSITNLKNDELLLDFAAKGNEKSKRQITFYCHARYNNVNRVIEDDQMQDNINVKVVDSSHISIEQLKQNLELHPVSYVDIMPDATVSSPFNALVIGFGEVGIDAVRFLYEFSAFVKHGTAKGDKVERSDFHCDVVDANMSVVAGPFLAAAPAIKTELTLKDGTRISSHDEAGSQDGEAAKTDVEANARPLLSLHEMDMMGVEFHKKLETWVSDLNYIVIATDDDENNMALAVRIFKLAVMYRPNLEHFRIMVCVKSDNDGHIRRTAEHYNRLWAAELQSRVDGTGWHQKSLSTAAIVDDPITVFGLNDTIYTYDYIISDKLVEDAKEFKRRYDDSIAALRKKLGEPAPTAKTWDDDYKDLMQLTEDYKGYSPTYTGMMRLRRIQSQNRQNCFHLFTKRHLAHVALGDTLFAVFSSNSFFRKENEIKYEWMDGAKPIDAVVDVLDVLARTEHLRWCASHEILGYRDEGDENFKDEAKLQHGCIKPWEKLTKEKQSYDYNIVDVSLGIIRG